MRIRKQVVRAIAWDTVGMFATSAITFLTTVLLVRLLGPAKFGSLAPLLALLGLGQMLASGGIRDALLRFIPKAMGEGRADAVSHMLLRAAAARLAMVAVTTVPLWLAGETVAAVVLGRPDLARYLWFLPFLLALPLFADLLSASLIALFRQREVRTADVLNKIIFGLGLLLLPMWHDPLYGVFTAWIAAWGAGIVWLATAAVGQGIVCRPSRTWPLPKGRWLRFSSRAYVLSLMGFILGRELDILLLTRLGTPGEAVAQYAVSFSFVISVLMLPLLPVAGGFELPLIAGLYGRQDWDGIRRYFRACFEYVYIFMPPLVGGGLLLGPSLVARIYGVTYGSAAGVLLLLLAPQGLTKLSGITGPLLLATDREGIMLKIRLTTAVVNVVLALALIPRFGPAGAALATGTAVLVTAIWDAVVVQRFLHPRYPWEFLARVALATGAMMAVVGVGRLAMAPDPGLLALFALVGLGGAAYLALLLWLRPVSLEHTEILAGVRVPGFARLLRRIARPGLPLRPALGDSDPG